MFKKMMMNLMKAEDLLILFLLARYWLSCIRLESFFTTMLNSNRNSGFLFLWQPNHTY